jgi:very-short-patch-repair endonuclease
VKGVPRHEPVALIGVLRDRCDLALLLRRGIYRIPVAHGPRRPFTHLAFYQPSAFGRSGKGIRLIAPVLGRARARRVDILPGEAGHPRANEWYWCYRVGKPVRLPRPVRNLSVRRVTFAYAPLRRLYELHDILEVFGVPPIERMMADAFRRARLPVLPEFTISADGRRYRLDFALFCSRGALAIECDGREFHGTGPQRARDRAKDAHLRRLGWTVLRLKEGAVVRSPGKCLARVVRAAKRLGGPAVESSSNGGKR